MRRRDLTKADHDVWHNYTRQVAALPGRALPTPAPETLLPARLAQTAPTTAALGPRPSTPLPFIAPGDRPSGLDDGAWTRLRTGKLRPERTLDLHGQTAQRAFHSLNAFLHQAQSHRLRCVEIITGRGTGESGGILRRELPLWLNLPSLRPYILAITHPHTGNPGSVRILLQRRR